jgi:RNA polymerase sigma factor (sigma-70 family)
MSRSASRRGPSAGGDGDPQRSQPLLVSTRVLLEQARAGDEPALEEICARFHHRLTRWAHGRLPPRARHQIDTADLVQDTLVGTIRRLETIHADHPESFPAYLRAALRNRIRQELRRLARQPARVSLDSGVRNRAPSPLEETIGEDVARRYEEALAGLAESDQSLLFLRLEMEMTYRDIAEALDKPSAEAARKAAARALMRLANQMQGKTP